MQAILSFNEIAIPMSRGKSGRCDGFSLMEMMVVLAITALAIAVAMPVYKRSATAQKLEVQAREIAALMRYGRTLAIRDTARSGRYRRQAARWDRGASATADLASSLRSPSSPRAGRLLPTPLR